MDRRSSSRAESILAKLIKPIRWTLTVFRAPQNVCAARASFVLRIQYSTNMFCITRNLNEFQFHRDSQTNRNLTIDGLSTHGLQERYKIHYSSFDVVQYCAFVAKRAITLVIVFAVTCTEAMTVAFGSLPPRVSDHQHFGYKSSQLL